MDGAEAAIAYININTTKPPMNDVRVRRAFNMAIDEIAGVSARLLASLETNAPARTREEEAARAKARNAARFPERSRQ